MLAKGCTLTCQTDNSQNPYDGIRILFFSLRIPGSYPNRVTRSSQGEEPRQTERSVFLKKKRNLAVLAALVASIAVGIGVRVFPIALATTRPSLAAVAANPVCEDGGVVIKGITQQNPGAPIHMPSVPVTFTDDSHGYGSVGPLDVGQNPVLFNLNTGEESISGGTATFAWTAGETWEAGSMQASYEALDCSPPPTDVCPNLDGVQTEVPEGYELKDGQCVEKITPPTVPPTSPPTTPTTSPPVTPPVVPPPAETPPPAPPVPSGPRFTG